MSIPDAAIEAAAHAVSGGREAFFDLPQYEQAYWRDVADHAIEAAMPAIREAIAQEILTELDKATCPVDDCRECRHHRELARIVRGGTP